MGKVGTWSSCSHKPCPHPHPSLTALLAPTPGHPAPLAPHYTLGHRPCSPDSFSEPQVPAKSWLCAEFLCNAQNAFSVQYRAPPPLCDSTGQTATTSAIHSPTPTPPNLPFTLPLQPLLLSPISSKGLVMKGSAVL